MLAAPIFALSLAWGYWDTFKTCLSFVAWKFSGFV
jgi:hypothetical protein